MDLIRAYLSDPGAWAGALTERMRAVPRILAALNGRFRHGLDANDLEDLVQDTMVLVLTKLDSYQGRGAFEGWLFHSCNFQLLNALRRKRRGALLVDDLDKQPSRATESGGEKELIAQEAAERALQALGGSEADVLRMRCLEEVSFEVIAVRLGLSVANAKVRYYRGLKKLAERMRGGLLGDGKLGSDP